MFEENEFTNLFDILNTTHDKYLSIQDEEKDIYEKMNQELAEAERKIKLSYQEKIDLSHEKCLALKEEIHDYCKLLEDYSTFDSNMIGHVISKLVSFVEGEKYCYQEATHNTYTYESTAFGSESFRANKKLLLIIKEDSRQGYYHDYDAKNDEVYRLSQRGEAFVLAKSDYDYKKKIRFYKADGGFVNCLIDFGRFSYVKTFIDLLVQHRFQNHLDQISEKELVRIMNEFVLGEKEMIEANYQKRAMEKQEQLRQQLMEEQERFEMMLKDDVPSVSSNKLIDRLLENANHNADFNITMGQFGILYEGEEHIARITCSEPLLSIENIFISKMDIESSIKDCFDDSDSDPKKYDIDLVDDGLIGIVDITNLRQDLTNVIDFSLLDKIYKVDRIDNDYLRVLYLPNGGKYGHNRLIGSSSYSNVESVSYKTDWDSTEEAEKMLACLEKIESVNSLNEGQFSLYKQRKNGN